MKPVTNKGFYGVLSGFILFSMVLILDDDGFIIVLDHANLLFHEAGHVFLGIFGYTAGLYGGTLGQFVFPVVTAISFYKKGATVALAVSGFWFFENFFYVATYVGDARTRNLPLVGGGDHDWYRILSSWNMLSYDTTFAGLLRLLGWLGLCITMIIIYRKWCHSRKKPRQRYIKVQVD